MGAVLVVETYAIEDKEHPNVHACFSQNVIGNPSQKYEVGEGWVELMAGFVAVMLFVGFHRLSTAAFWRSDRSNFFQSTLEVAFVTE